MRKFIVVPVWDKWNIALEGVDDQCLSIAGIWGERPLDMDFRCKDTAQAVCDMLNDAQERGRLEW